LLALYRSYIVKKFNNRLSSTRKKKPYMTDVLISQDDLDRKHDPIGSFQSLYGGVDASSTIDQHVIDSSSVDDSSKFGGIGKKGETAAAAPDPTDATDVAKKKKNKDSKFLVPVWLAIGVGFVVAVIVVVVVIMMIRRKTFAGIANGTLTAPPNAPNTGLPSGSYGSGTLFALPPTSIVGPAVAGPAAAQNIVNEKKEKQEIAVAQGHAKKQQQQQQFPPPLPTKVVGPKNPTVPVGYVTVPMMDNKHKEAGTVVTGVDVSGSSQPAIKQYHVKFTFVESPDDYKLPQAMKDTFMTQVNLTNSKLGVYSKARNDGEREQALENLKYDLIRLMNKHCNEGSSRKDARLGPINDKLDQAIENYIGCMMDPHSSRQECQQTLMSEIISSIGNNANIDTVAWARVSSEVQGCLSKANCLEQDYDCLFTFYIKVVHQLHLKLVKSPPTERKYSLPHAVLSNCFSDSTNHYIRTLKDLLETVASDALARAKIQDLLNTALSNYQNLVVGCVCLVRGDC
jgi:hypothetical protein